MTPNLFVALHTVSTPHRWFARKRKPSNVDVAPIEHWESPVPGRYELVPGDGWYLVLADNPATLPADLPPPPLKVVYSRVLKRFLFEQEYRSRQRQGALPLVPAGIEGSGSRPSSRQRGSGDLRRSPTASSGGKSRSRPSSLSGVSGGSHVGDMVGFFQLDDGVTWVNDQDAKGRFVEGPYPRFCLCKETGHFRLMVKGDDPNWRRNSRQERGRLGSTDEGLSVKSTSRPTSMLTPSSESRRASTKPDESGERPISPRAGSSNSLLATVAGMPQVADRRQSK